MANPIATTISDSELWACASEALRQHGDRAPVFVAERIGALALTGDAAGVEVWKAIAARIVQLRDGWMPLAQPLNAQRPNGPARSK